MKIIKIKFDIFNKLIKKYKECKRANKALNKEIREYNRDR